MKRYLAPYDGRLAPVSYIAVEEHEGAYCALIDGKTPIDSLPLRSDAADAQRELEVFAATNSLTEARGYRITQGGPVATVTYDADEQSFAVAYEGGEVIAGLDGFSTPQEAQLYLDDYGRRKGAEVVS